MRTHELEFFRREVEPGLPDRVFDAHCHLLAPEQTEVRLPDGVVPPVNRDAYHRDLEQLHGSKTRGALYIPFPGKREGIAAANEWIGAAVSESAGSDRGLFLVTPEDDPEWVRDEVSRLSLHGLKCYHVYAANKPTWNADVSEFLPEALVRVADEERWVITLHLVKSRAVADPSNQQWIRRTCERYPGMTLILAHNARGFQPAHTLQGLPALADLPNLWCDTSANCESMATLAAIRALGPERVMYGSDYWVSHMRGRSVAAGDSFLWLYEDTPVWGEKHTRIDPVLVGLEHLRSVEWACWAGGLTPAEKAGVYHDNAARLFGLNVA